MAVHFVVVFVIGIVGPKKNRAYATAKMFQVELLVDGCNVRSTQGITTLSADKVESAKIVSFTKGFLSPIRSFNGEKPGSNRLIAILKKTELDWMRCCPARAPTTVKLTRQLKQPQWKVPSSARTNSPSSGRPHLVQCRVVEVVVVVVVVDGWDGKEEQEEGVLLDEHSLNIVGGLIGTDRMFLVKS